MPSLAQRAFCEALGTAFLLAAVVGSGIMAQRLAGGNGALALLCNTIPTGAILAVLILVFGPISGAHFNPAVSLGFALRRKLAWPIAGLYIVVQVLGGIGGGNMRAARHRDRGNGLDRRPADEPGGSAGRAPLDRKLRLHPDVPRFSQPGASLL